MDLRPLPLTRPPLGLAHFLDEKIEWHYQFGSPPVIGTERTRRTLERLVTHQLEVAWQLVRVAEAGEPLEPWLTALVERPGLLD